MMSRCLVFICCLIAVKAATLDKRHIPVEIVYDKFRPTHYSIRNLDEKVQLSEDLLKLKLGDEIVMEPAEEVQKLMGNPNGVKNLEEKVQLSPEELGVALKHLPNTIDDDDLVKSELAEETENSKPEAVTEVSSAMSLLKKAEKIVFLGINSIKSDIDKVAENFNGSKPSLEAWEKFNQTLRIFFRDQYRLDLKQDKPTETENNQNQNFQVIQSVLIGVQNISSDFLHSITKQNRPSEDEQKQGEQGAEGGQGGGSGETPWWQNMLDNFGQIFNNITNLVGQNNNNNNGASGQEDTGTSNNNAGGSGTNNGIIGFFTQFFQGPSQPSGSTEKPVQGDEGTDTTSTTQRNPFEVFQNFGNQIGNQINNFLGGQGNQNKPPNPEDEGATTAKPPSFVDNISQAFQNLFPNQGGSGGSGSNPISSVTNQFQQLAGGQPGGPIQSVQNAISGGSGATTEKNKDEDSPPKNGTAPQEDVNQKKDPEEQKESEEIKNSDEKKESLGVQEEVTEMKESEQKKDMEKQTESEVKKESEETKESEEKKESEVKKESEETKESEEKKDSGVKIESEEKVESEMKPEAAETVDKMT